MVCDGERRKTRRQDQGVSIEGRQFPQFYLTPPAPCPYLRHRQERKVFTHLIGDQAGQLNDVLTNGGFRRSQNIAYRPACETCNACVSVRVLVDDFVPTKSLKRTWSLNRDVTTEWRPARATPEQYSVFRSYIDARHGDGGMADMTVLDFAAMVEDSFVDTRIVEYYAPPGELDETPSTMEPELAAVALTDTLNDGLSMVYSFFEPGQGQRSLGNYMILDHIERTRKLGLPYLYLGYWVKDSRKMDYKSRFRPQEHLMADGWICQD